MSRPRIKLSNSQTLVLDGVETGISLLDFTQQLRRKNAEVPDICFTLLHAAGISPTLILNQNAKIKKRGSWVPFKTVCAFLTMITKKNRPQKILFDKETEFAGEFEKLCKAEGIQIYSTMSETKASFAEHTIRSLKNMLYRYMEDNGYKYNHKLTHFVTTVNSRRNCSIDLIPRNVKNSDFSSILHNKPLREFRKTKFKVGDSVRISKYDLPFRKGSKPQSTKEVFKIVAISSKNLQHTEKRMNKMRISAVNFIRKS